MTSDAHKGLVRAIEEVFQGGSWQRCAVHLMRDCMREAGSRQLKKRVGRIMSPVFRAKDAATARAMYHVACDMLRDCCPKAADVAEETEPDALAYLAFPPSHWKRLRTNNVQERANREIKRRSRVVQVFPSERSLERLVGAVMCELDEQWSESRYFAYGKIQELYDERRAAEAAPERPSAELAEVAREDDHREHGACGKGGGGVAWPIRFRDSGEGPNPRPSRIAVRSGCLRQHLSRTAYTNFSGTTYRQHSESNGYARQHPSNREARGIHHKSSGTKLRTQAATSSHRTSRVQR